MDIYGAKFREHCFIISRDIAYSVFTTFQLQYWHLSYHWSNLHNRKTSISLKRKKIFQKEKRHSFVFWKAFQISRKMFCVMYTLSAPFPNCKISSFTLMSLKAVRWWRGEGYHDKTVKENEWYFFLQWRYYTNLHYFHFQRNIQFKHLQYYGSLSLVLLYGQRIYCGNYFFSFTAPDLFSLFQFSIVKSK